MTEASENEWYLSIFVPGGGEADEAPPPDEAVEKHALKDYLSAFGRVEKVPAKSVEAQWQETLDTLMKLTTVSGQSEGWIIKEIEAGLTLSAKGELLFIAEAGAEASIKFILKRKGS